MTVEGAKKAWETRRKKQIAILEEKQNQEKTYDVKLKNKFRKKVIEFFHKGATTLALESQEFLFVDNLPDCEFILFEHDYETYKKLVSGNRKNALHIFNADISAARFLAEDITQAYLDFCCTFETAIPSIVAIYPKLRRCDKIAITFCLRGNKKEIEDYKFDLLKKIQDLFEHFKLEYATSYRDGAPMVGLLLSNRFKEVWKRSNEKTTGEITLGCKLFTWCESYARKTWGIALFSRAFGIPGVVKTRWRDLPIENHRMIEELYDKMPSDIKNDLKLLVLLKSAINYKDTYETLAVILFDIYFGTGDSEMNEEPYKTLYGSDACRSVMDQMYGVWNKTSEKLNDEYIQKLVKEHGGKMEILK
jgi:hypothetical protein